MTLAGRPRVYIHASFYRRAASGRRVVALSSDGAPRASAAEHGDILHHAVRVLDARSGETAGDQQDGGRRLTRRPVPVPGDHRLAIRCTSVARGTPRHLGPDTGERRDLEVRPPRRRFWSAGTSTARRCSFATSSRNRRAAYRPADRHDRARRGAPRGAGGGRAAGGRAWLVGDDAVRSRVMDDEEHAGPLPGNRRAGPFHVQYGTCRATHPGPLRRRRPAPTAPHDRLRPRRGQWHFRTVRRGILAYVDRFAVAMVNYRGSATECSRRLRNMASGERDPLACLDALIAGGGPRSAFFVGGRGAATFACLNVGSPPPVPRRPRRDTHGDYVDALELLAAAQAWTSRRSAVTRTRCQSSPRSELYDVRAFRGGACLIIAGRNDGRCRSARRRSGPMRTAPTAAGSRCMSTTTGTIPATSRNAPGAAGMVAGSPARAVERSQIYAKAIRARALP